MGNPQVKENSDRQAKNDSFPTGVAEANQPGVEDSTGKKVQLNPEGFWTQSHQLRSLELARETDNHFAALGSLEGKKAGPATPFCCPTANQLVIQGPFPVVGAARGPTSDLHHAPSPSASLSKPSTGLNLIVQSPTEATTSPTNTEATSFYWVLDPEPPARIPEIRKTENCFAASGSLEGEEAGIATPFCRPAVNQLVIQGPFPIVGVARGPTSDLHRAPSPSASLSESSAGLSSVVQSPTKAITSPANTYHCLAISPLPNMMAPDLPIGVAVNSSTDLVPCSHSVEARPVLTSSDDLQSGKVLDPVPLARILGTRETENRFAALGSLEGEEAGPATPFCRPVANQLVIQDPFPTVGAAQGPMSDLHRAPSFCLPL
ncbi:hypothetical protein NE237_001872 [Protea cynaroides]|uniref:Uncharacterized protein n=1 Tax=Protea cynaroides TaxID=273540 RepID=A0A9Q0KU66_9MAGN|nr:hypothetical protein NE237_001872 [Protea cynaroides]